MKYAIILIVTCFIIVLSCNTGKENSELISQNNHPIEQFTINSDRDTVLQTGNGALLKIPAGALENKNGKSVTLEIKEAYSMQQIIKAGLFTQSNGEPLSSGGMIYINAAAGQEVTFKQKIQVAIPTDFLQEGMQLYEGNEQADGTVNWENPDTLPVNKQLSTIEKGKTLFQQQCSSCHIIGKDATGPDLAHLKNRFDDPGEGMERYFEHGYYADQYPCCGSFADNANKSRFDETATDRYFHPDPYYVYKCNLISRFNGLIAPRFLLTDSGGIEYLSIIDYIQNESDRLNLPLPKQTTLKDCADSCVLYNSKTSELNQLKKLTQTQRQKLIKDNGEMTVVKPDSTWRQRNDNLPPPDFDEKVSPENFEATYYQFSVESFGWYNIDMLLEKMNNGVVESELFVRIVGEYTERVNVFLIIPSVKVYGEGGPAEDDTKYAFFYKTGKLPLPQNTKAYILALTEQDEKIAFALKEFTTGTKQEFEIALQTSTKEKFEAALKNFDTNRLHIKVDKTKNADSIRVKDKEIRDIDLQLKDAEHLKPKNCDCDCGTKPVAANSFDYPEDYIPPANISLPDEN